jgi:fumarate hydratase subunit beta
MNRKTLVTPLDDNQIAPLRAGDEVALSGVIYTARDVAHKRFMALLKSGAKLPLDLSGQVLYYCGPTPAKPGRPIGSAGPTTSSRMDVYTPDLLAATNLRGMIGKGERNAAVIDAIRQWGCVYFAAVGGAGMLIARSVAASLCICYDDLGPEAVYRLEVREMPLIVAIDSSGNDLYVLGRAKYKR